MSAEELAVDPVTAARRLLAPRFMDGVSAPQSSRWRPMVGCPKARGRTRRRTPTAGSTVAMR
ncbi:putative 3-methyladenine DNA glycosylase domain protein [Mycobacterium xenopi 3993]|nr:putative 3-methyladenine DNA glycosylase domain protein [Mycobacterium xenopi 3993]